MYLGGLGEGGDVLPLGGTLGNEVDNYIGYVLQPNIMTNISLRLHTIVIMVYNYTIFEL